MAEFGTKKYWLEKVKYLEENPLPGWSPKKELRARKKKIVILKELYAEAEK